MKDETRRMAEFVAASYRPGRLDPGKAMKTLRRQRGSGRSMAWIPVLAGVALLVAVAANIWLNKWEEYQAADTVAAVRLADGSAVTLSPGSTVRLRPHRSTRHVQFTGRALFEVARDESHPFEIDIDGGGYVKVLGTRFQIVSGEEASVDVMSGKVLFAAAPGEHGVILTAGQGAALSGEAPVIKSEITLNPAVWATGRYSYDDAPLEQVLDELGRAYGLTLKTEARGRRLTGSFAAGDLKDIIGAISAALDIDIEAEEGLTR